MRVRRSFPFVLAIVLFTRGGSGAAQEQSGPSTPICNRVCLDRLAPEQPRTCDTERDRTLPFVRTELFFGTAKPDGVVTLEEFQAFLDEVVTPLFPGGLTVVTADGQFRGAGGIAIRERSYVVILIYPFEEQHTSGRNIDTIRLEYMRRYRQESVLRADETVTTRIPRCEIDAADRPTSTGDGTAVDDDTQTAPQEH